MSVTQNWIYNQLIYNTECKSAVLCQRLENISEFPFPEVHPICKGSGLSSVPARIQHKLLEQYPLKPHLSVINDFKPKVLHAHFLLEAWRNYRLIAQSGLPLVTTTYGQDVSSLWKRPFWMNRYHKIFELGSAYIVEGPFMKRALASLGCPEDKISVIKLGVDLSRIKKKEHKGKNSKVKILFTGLNREKKGALIAATAFAQVCKLTEADLEFHLIGNGVFRKHTEAILEQNGVLQKAVFHGYIPVNKYLELLSESDIVLAPSVQAKDGDNEGGAPVVVIEALAAGIPVVGSLHCDIPNIVQQGETGLLSKEKDVESLTRDLLLLVWDKDLRMSMGKRGILYAESEHDIRKQVEKITAVYRKSLLDEHF